MTVPTPATPGPLRRRIIAAAARLGCTEGQLQSVAIGLAVALVTAVVGLPPVFEDRLLADLAAPAPAAAADGSGAAPAAPPSAVDASVGGPAPAPVASGARAGARPDPGAATPDPGAGPTAPDGPPATPSAPTSKASIAGDDGDCGVERRSIDNPRRVAGAAPTPVWIFEPTGEADASIAGGSCGDGERPVVLLAHGFGQTDPAAYDAMIHHLVSVGNIVVYPVYEVADGERSSLEESTRVVDAGFVAATEQTPRADTRRVGVWGHSHGGGMVPFLVQQVGGRRWGEEALWLSNVAQAFSQLVGAGDIPVPSRARALTVAFQHDAFADARLGIDIFGSLVLPAMHKRHVTVLSDPATGSVADHGAPSSTSADADDVDHLLWRYADLLQLCATDGDGCDADLTTVPGAATPRAVVRDEPVDVGPYPAILAECDAGFGPTLNPRTERCGETKI